MIKKVLISCLALVILIVLFLVGTEAVYADQLMPNISIERQAFAKQNRTEIKDALTKYHQSLKTQGFILTREGKKVKAKIADTGISFDVDKEIDQAFSLSHDRILGLGTVKTIWSILNNQQNINPVLKVDETQKQKFLNETVHKNFSILATDATLNISDTSIDVSADKDGLWVEDNLLWTEIEKVASGLQNTVAVPVISKKADIKPGDLGDAKIEAEKILGWEITLTAGNKKIVADRSVVKDWIVVHTEQNKVSAGVDAEKIKKYLTDVAAPKLEQGATAQITSPDGTVIAEGNDGTKLKIDDSVSAIVDAINKGEDNPTIKLSTEVKSRSTQVFDPQSGGTPGLSDGKYIEVSLTLQRMYLYEGTNFINSFGVSTGKWSTPTPVGTFSIQNHIRTAYSTPYDLYMPFWNAITADGQYGIHGLPYRGNWVEGASHIGTPVSHGCIRLGPGNDEYVFGWADIGTPVFIHK